VSVARPRPSPPAPKARRLFAPGSEWLYAKVYAARSSIDHVLVSACEPVLARALAEGVADRWFFIRYGDPEPHLRLRVHGEAAKLLAEVLPAIHGTLAPLVDAGRVQRLELGTYDREIERYGGDHGIDLAETIFWADSEAALALAKLDRGADDQRSRRAAVLLGMHRLLDDFDLDLATRIRLTGHLARGYGAEQRHTAAQERRLADFARQERGFVDDVLGGDTRDPVDAVFALRSRRVRGPARALRTERRAGRLGVSTEALVDSLLHMWCNRMLRSNARAQEHVLHTLLARHYESQEARQRRAAKAGVLPADGATRPGRASGGAE
jgi:thiopeptide-type bacteriocin biosynthesis protein